MLIRKFRVFELFEIHFVYGLFPFFSPLNVQIAENCLCYLSKRIYHLLWLGKDVQEKICDYVVCLQASMYNIYTVRRVREKTSGYGRSKRQSCPPLQLQERRRNQFSCQTNWEIAACVNTRMEMNGWGRNTTHNTHTHTHTHTYTNLSLALSFLKLLWTTRTRRIPVCAFRHKRRKEGQTQSAQVRKDGLRGLGGHHYGPPTC